MHIQWREVGCNRLSTASVFGDTVATLNFITSAAVALLILPIFQGDKTLIRNRCSSRTQFTFWCHLYRLVNLWSSQGLIM